MPETLPAKARSHRDLRVWKAAKRLVLATYDLTRSFPVEERFGLTSQTRRAAVSVLANIAEGWGRGGRAELHRYVTMARGSLYELDSLLELSEALEFAPTSKSAEVRAIADEVGRMCSVMRTSLHRRR